MHEPKHGIAISTDGRGCWCENVCVERLWINVKCEGVYLKAYDRVSAARVGIAAHIGFCNARRPHRTQGGRTPDMAYFATPPQCGARQGTCRLSHATN